MNFFKSSEDYLSKMNSSISLDEITKYLNKRVVDGEELPINVATSIVRKIFSKDEDSLQLSQVLLEYSKTLRNKIYGNKYLAMVPIELTSFCASNCTFCGWSKNEKGINRARLSKNGLERQLKKLAPNFSHIELAMADDISFLKNDLYEYVSLTRSKIENKELSICCTPLRSSHYRRLKKEGVDTIIMWQETYDRDLFKTYISEGPKAYGLTDEFQLSKEYDGFEERLKSVDRALNNGLKVGIGCMIGLHKNPEKDVLATILHGRAIIKSHDLDKTHPIILGMPTFNNFSDKNNLMGQFSNAEIEKVFPLVGAIYLLSMPDGLAWIFPNCRVSHDTQAFTLETSGYFTSTSVRLDPAGYLENSEYASSLKNEIDRSFKNRPVEQFQHYYSTHQEFIKLFEERSLVEDQVI